MASRAIQSLVNGKRLREQGCQSTWMVATSSNLTQETHFDTKSLGDVETNGSRMPPSPRFAALLGVVETESLEIVNQTMKMGGNGDDVQAPGTVLKRCDAVGYNGTTQYPSGEGTSKSRPPLPLPKWMTTESSPRREDIAVAMQKGTFVESSPSTFLVTTTTKAVVGSPSRRFATQYDDADLELVLACSSSSNYTGSLLETGKLLGENFERRKPKSNLTMNLDDIDDAHVKRLKLDDSSNPSCAHQHTTKLFGAILETSSVQAAPNKSGGIETMPTAYAWLRRWLPNGGKVVNKPEGVGPPENEERRPSIAAMAMMGRAVLNDYHKPCEVQKMGAVTLWKT